MSTKKSDRKKVTYEAPNLFAERLENFKTMFPEVLAEGKVDFDKLKTALGEETDGKPERYSFTWAGKKDAIRLLQVPSRASLVPYKDESVDFDTTQNIFIEGDNLEVLKLLWKPYFGSVRMMYIDPPYNTGNDFIYNDNYADPLNTYLMLTGQKDAEGNLLTSNPQTSGRFHSSWLSMMYPRLFFARQLLKEDGIIFISIDDNEIHNLRLIMNEIFGEDAFIGQFIWKSRQQKDNRNVTGASIDHEYVLCYGKRVRGDERKLDQYSNPDNDPRGDWTSANMVGLLPEDKRPNCHFNLIDPETGIDYGKPNLGWRYDKNTMARLIEEKRIIWPPSPSGRPRRKVFLNELQNKFTGYSSIIGQDIYTRHGTEEMNDLFGLPLMEFPKPSSLVAELVEQGSEKDDIILDFFAGSCPTSQSVLGLNRKDGGTRKYIVVQLPEPTLEDSVARKAGYNTIADIGKERIRRVIAKMNNESKGKMDLNDREMPEDSGFKVFKLAESNYRRWVGVEEKDPEEYAKQMELYLDPLLEGWQEESVIYEVTLKEGYSLSSHIEKVKEVNSNRIWKVSDDDKEQSFHICLDGKIDEEAVRALELNTDNLFICRDIALTDELAANLALQCNLKVI